MTGFYGKPSRCEPRSTQHRELQLNNLEKTRHVIVHDYDIIDYHIVWTIITEHLSQVAEAVDSFLTLHEHDA